MPYIEVKLAKQASRKQERILTEKLGEAITTVPGKTAAGLMVSISSDEHIYKEENSLNMEHMFMLFLKQE